LRQGWATGGLDAGEEGDDLRAGGVAVGAAKVAAGEAEEDLALADENPFALDGGEDLDDGSDHRGIIAGRRWIEESVRSKSPEATEAPDERVEAKSRRVGGNGEIATVVGD
jgi:hypothetical protein